jgi:hypothetical protein
MAPLRTKSLAHCYYEPRSQMGFSLGWHIILACLGVGMPGLVLFAEWRG